MIENTGNVRHEITMLVPSSLLEDIACFTFYDNHPRGEKNIDITICTTKGLVKEFFQRSCVSTLELNCDEPTSIRILRNNDLKLFYLVGTENDLFILSSERELKIHRKLSNISSYDVKDAACSGNSYLQVIKKDDAVPIILDNNFESMDDIDVVHSIQDEKDAILAVIELKRKLIEATLATQSNQKTYSSYLNLRQRVAMLSNQSSDPYLEDGTIRDEASDTYGALKIKIQKPKLKVCNKKVIMTINVFNDNKEPLENIHMLVNNTTPSLTYSNKLYTKLSESPFWKECSTLKLDRNKESTVVTVLGLEDVKPITTSIVELSGLLTYKRSGRVYFTQLEDVFISSFETMGDKFDVLSKKETDHDTILAVLASTEKTDLHLRHIRNMDEPEVSVLELFRTHLQMEQVGNTANVIMYRKSPYHVLNGTMIIFHENGLEKAVQVSVHTRSISQLLALLHLIYDKVPAKLIATTPNYKITSKSADLSHYNEEINTPGDINYMDYATSVLNRGAKILEHLDNSMIQMSESRNPAVTSQVGSHIDVFAGGVENFKEFRKYIIEEAKKGVDSLMKVSLECNTPDEVMLID